MRQVARHLEIDTALFTEIEVRNLKIEVVPKSEQILKDKKDSPINWQIN